MEGKGSHSKSHHENHYLAQDDSSHLHCSHTILISVDMQKDKQKHSQEQDHHILVIRHKTKDLKSNIPAF